MARRSISHFGWPRIIALTLIALTASVAPLPGWLELVRPDFVALTVLWFSLLSPRLTGLFHAWGAGLALDAFRGVLLGQHALSLTVIAYVAAKLRLQVRAFPPLQQTAVILALLWLNEFLLFGVEPLDPAAFGVSIAIVAAVTLLANWVPARRSAGVSALAAMRQD
jgi:rod shape-determining protein MreD